MQPAGSAPRNVQDELFVTRFELQALADAVVSGKSERWVEGFVPLSTSLAHRRRYEHAALRAAGRRVLDLSCGAGAGSYTMATAGAASVLGLDIDHAAVRYARLRYAHEHCSFREAAAETWRPDSTYDLVVSFETIEHLRRPELLLAALKRALAPDGEGLISTPIAPTDRQQPGNPYHVQEWTEAGFIALLAAAGFVVKETWYQAVRGSTGIWGKVHRTLRRALGGTATGGLSLSDGALRPMAPYRRLGLHPKFQVHLITHSVRP